MAVVAEKKKLRIGFIHPDLGIGGAEKLVVDAAVSLQRRGHEVVIFTSRHDPQRCFEETRDGTLKVHVLGSSLPMRLHPKVPLTIVFSILRSLLLTVLLLFSLLLPGPASPMNPLSPIERFDVFVVDQQSVCVPLLRFVSGSRVVFYCHFPDKLLSQGWTIGPEGKSVRGGGGLLRKLYRWPVDKLEEWTTGQSDVILANSKFTSQVYSNVFPSLSNREPKVVYPCIDLDQYKSSKLVKGKGKADKGVDLISYDGPMIISLNRFEAKKNVALAIKAFAALHNDQAVPASVASSLRMVIAGGYDKDLPDNIETLEGLQSLCETEGLNHQTIHGDSSSTLSRETQVVFLLNFTSSQRSYLLSAPNSLCLLYTPSNEHFGIVPIEAGACGLPVLATNSGGPLETIIDGETGFLRSPEPRTWAKALGEVVLLPDQKRKQMGETARKRVNELFTLDNLGKEMEESCRQALGMGDLHNQVGDRLIWGSLGLIALSGIAMALTFITA